MSKQNISDLAANVEHGLASRYDELKQRAARVADAVTDGGQEDSRSGLERAQIHSRDGIELSVESVRVAE